MRLRIGIAVVMAAFLTPGCGSDHVVGPGSPPVSKYPKLINPYSVLDALQIAYQDKDTTEIKVLYHDQYDGSSIDQTDPAPATVTFTKANEVAHVSALRHSSSIGSINLTSAPGRERFSDGADPPGWATIRNPFTAIEISDATTTRTVDMAHITMEFKFIPKTPDSSSPTDTTWKIIRWTEVRVP
ncbi:MAG: hypothetical protein E6K75_04825 [Candidatus Eisenbacteria bacterium]|uniref:Uncharacterized protein n=1 Tax=Eiseniibacteriota bacterium TaxID=2212470 RepID=A0A538T5E7_UNCEI|nr:MAG: hypothetical protein E6K75_04825 [Candidatus Eisenbacteria bacterium]